MTAGLAETTGTRTRILDIALELFSEQGYAGTSIRELAERMGFTKAALYYHFRTKDDLLAELVAPAMGVMRELVDGLPVRNTPANRRDVLRRYVALVVTHARLVRLLSLDPAGLQSAALSDVPVLYDRLLRYLTGVDEPGVTDIARCVVAVGGVNAAITLTAYTGEIAEVEQAAFLAACGALGLPVPRTR